MNALQDVCESVAEGVKEVGRVTVSSGKGLRDLGEKSWKSLKRLFSNHEEEEADEETVRLLGDDWTEVNNDEDSSSRRTPTLDDFTG